MFTMYSKLRPSMMLNLIRRLVFDVSLLNEHIKMPLKVKIQKKIFNLWYRISNSNITLCNDILLIMDFSQLLTSHYERCWKYYCLTEGWGNFGAASDEELHLTRKLFWGIFDALSHKVNLVAGPSVGIYSLSLHHYHIAIIETINTIQNLQNKA